LHVSVDPDGALRARHEFAFCGVRFLTLHYYISRRNFSMSALQQRRRPPKCSGSGRGDSSANRPKGL
jgi:hypothetical protein